MRPGFAATIFGLWLLLVAQGVVAQTVDGVVDPSPVASPILTIDPEALFTQSLYGQRLLRGVQAETEALAAQNRDLAASLTAEEKDLADRRPTMDPAAFRAEAEAFDARVQDIRTARDAKERALQDSVAAGRDQFFGAATPVLGEIMRDRGAVVLLDRRSVIISAGAVDITDPGIAAVDAALGDGSMLTAPDPAPAPETVAPSDPAPMPAPQQPEDGN